MFRKLWRSIVEFLLPTRKCNRCLAPLGDDPAATFPRFCADCTAIMATPSLSVSDMAWVDALSDAAWDPHDPADIAHH